MKEQLEKIYSDASKDLENAQSVKDLEDIKNKYLSRKGEFNEIKKGLKDLSIEDKKIVGSLANEIGQKLEKAIADKFNFASLEFQSLEGIIEAIGIDECKLCTYCWNGKED